MSDCDNVEIIMKRRSKEYPYGYDKPQPDPETLVTAIAVVENMYSDTPNWLDEYQEALRKTSDRIREKTLSLAESERFIRSVGTLATLDVAKLDEMVEEKRYAILAGDE